MILTLTEQVHVEDLTAEVVRQSAREGETKKVGVSNAGSWPRPPSGITHPRSTPRIEALIRLNDIRVPSSDMMRGFVPRKDNGRYLELVDGKAQGQGLAHDTMNLDTLMFLAEATNRTLVLPNLRINKKHMEGTYSRPCRWSDVYDMDLLGLAVPWIEEKEFQRRIAPRIPKTEIVTIRTRTPLKGEQWFDTGATLLVRQIEEGVVAHELWPALAAISNRAFPPLLPISAGVVAEAVCNHDASARLDALATNPQPLGGALRLAHPSIRDLASRFVSLAFGGVGRFDSVAIRRGDRTKHIPKAEVTVEHMLDCFRSFSIQPAVYVMMKASQGPAFLQSLTEAAPGAGYHLFTSADVPRIVGEDVYNEVIQFGQQLYVLDIEIAARARRFLGSVGGGSHNVLRLRLLMFGDFSPLNLLRKDDELLLLRIDEASNNGDNDNDTDHYHNANFDFPSFYHGMSLSRHESNPIDIYRYYGAHPKCALPIYINVVAPFSMVAPSDPASLTRYASATFMTLDSVSVGLDGDSGHVYQPVRSIASTCPVSCVVVDSSLAGACNSHPAGHPGG
eukprot:TRINITY_DN2876_c0_g1_i3.p1 TRINITY_DN2876_c0_g1~~TRINITY_DN2876_c0_g1_i3.p1  ORF type:complete len:563 (+),score=50.71 TRINITY_DN2876_c0_g1_i3:199-1887(+)